MALHSQPAAAQLRALDTLSITLWRDSLLALPLGYLALALRANLRESAAGPGALKTLLPRYPKPGRWFRTPSHFGSVTILWLDWDLPAGVQGFHQIKLLQLSVACLSERFFWFSGFDWMQSRVVYVKVAGSFPCFGSPVTLEITVFILSKALSSPVTAALPGNTEHSSLWSLLKEAPSHLGCCTVLGCSRVIHYYRLRKPRHRRGKPCNKSIY